MFADLLFQSLCGLGLVLYGLVLVVPMFRPVRLWYARQAAQATLLPDTHKAP